ncbi:tol-pal system protein YbgF [Roseobacter sinensis]|uniref:Cell division coordinator CpoB n=1 Tax=Roseobacter sinensis TaxID=2931391 RepID=A0ABT3BH33_9RHOB|nr:tol-pal system protein YbgF [Roseobacter sp. WL0113]MCV3272891.1 tol-pal system protein YbgF [Roseobacter sp. WL0113]
MRIFAAFLSALILLPLSAQAQDDQTLADIRQEMTVLYVEIQKLRRELSTTGAATVNTGGATVLDRMSAIEAEMQRLTSKTEELEFRINSIVQDGTNRLGDLEFRLVELEGGDVAALGETTTLGGDLPAPVTPTPGTGTAPAAPQGGIQLAVGEEEDFKRAQTALSEGDYQRAADLFATFTQTYPGGPLAAGADLGRGEALEELGDTREAARAYLDSFSVDPTGPVAPQSLFRLGRSLGGLGQTQEACVTLGEVGLRFPQDPAAEQARGEMQRLGCA